MKAVGIRNGKGDADALFIEDGVPDPVVEKDKILVRIKAFGLNRMDTMQREGNYPARPHWGNILVFCPWLQPVYETCSVMFDVI
jgi:NADPH:quinone reductase-like Zn-dependent oxidoreductase